MANMVIFASIIDWIKWPFGFLLRESYQLTHSYAVAIIIFALIIRVILFPLSIKQQKGMIAQAKLRPKEMKIRNKYKGRNDKATQAKLNEEIMELYKQENYSPFSGCLPLLIQLPVILILFYVVTAPITYIVPKTYDSDIYVRTITETYEGNVVDKSIGDAINLPSSYKDENGEVVKYPENTVFRFTSDGKIYDDAGREVSTGKISAEKINSYRKNAVSAAIADWKFTEESQKARAGTYKELDFMRALNDSYSSEDEAKKESADTLLATIPGMDLVLNFDGYLFGFIDLLQKPKFFNWILLIPLLSGILSFLSARISKKLNNVAPAAEADASKSLKIMDYAMPLFSVYIAYIVPGAVGFYWMMSNVFMIGQSFLLSKLYPIPDTEKIMEEARIEEKNEKRRAKGKPVIESEPISEQTVETTETTELNGIEIGTLKDNK